jgi:hypothetical protein
LSESPNIDEWRRQLPDKVTCTADKTNRVAASAVLDSLASGKKNRIIAQTISQLQHGMTLPFEGLQPLRLSLPRRPSLCLTPASCNTTGLQPLALGLEDKAQYRSCKRSLGSAMEK